MSTSSPNWFNEQFKDRITIDLQAFGGVLDGTMMAGDAQAGTYKFPVVGGQSAVYKLTGAIQQVPVNDLGLTTVSVSPEDFEAAEWWTTQDAYKAGASEQDALKKLITMAVRRKRDQIKYEAIRAYYDANTSAIETVGDGSAVISPTDLEYASGGLDIYGDMDMDTEVYCMLPSLWFRQLEMYDYWANKDYGAGVSDVFNKTQKSRMKTIRGVTYIQVPDSYIREPTSGKWESFMWRKNAFGAETPFNNESPNIQQVFTMQGSPWLAKANISGCALGILTKGVKRILMKELTTITNPN